MKEYIFKLYKARYFWMYLARTELRNKFRRSKLGILWTFISPLLLTGIMAIVFSTVFNAPITEYAPYILSGILVWEVLSGAFVSGSMIFMSNEGFIRQFNHPITIYTLKSSIVYIVSFLISMISLLLWVLFINPQNLILGIITLPLTLVIYFILIWAASTIAAFTNAKYRDYPQLMAILMQTIWYLSPVFFQQNMFEKNEMLFNWFKVNPITHLLFLVRNPFLYGKFPTIDNYLISIGFVVVIAVFAYFINRKNKNSVIFYL